MSVGLAKTLANQEWLRFASFKVTECDELVESRVKPSMLEPSFNRMGYLYFKICPCEDCYKIVSGKIFQGSAINEWLYIAYCNTLFIVLLPSDTDFLF